MAKTKFYIKIVDKNGVDLYYRLGRDKQELIDGVLMTYTEFEFTEDINRADYYFDEHAANDKIRRMSELRPKWVEEFKPTVYRKMGNKEFIAVNTRPLATLLKAIKGYQVASPSGKKNIIEKVFNDNTLFNACIYSLNELNKLK